MDLFEAAAAADPTGVPLAERMRPKKLDDVVGQPHLTGPSSILARSLKQGRVPSAILWGPPGTGKTTIAECLAHEVNARFVKMSAVLAGVADLRKAIDDARRLRAERRVATLLFVDEIHRFNKAQQDALLPHVENGTVTFIGATTENPSFEVNAALLSRCRVLVLKPVQPEGMQVLLDRALTSEKGLKDHGVAVDDVARKVLISAAGGDARKLLTSLEVACDLAEAEGRKVIERADVEAAVQRRVLLYDKDGEQHYEVISAFIKSMRGSDPDAALYWGFRMLEAGEDPLFVLRRMVIFASEDVGNADAMGLVVATSALTAFQLVGMPEGAIPIAHAITYLASAPKSNASYLAMHAARKDIAANGSLPVPLHLRPAPTKLMEHLGHGKDYKYPHDHAGGYVVEQYLPDQLKDRNYYIPKELGAEAAIKGRLDARKKPGDQR
ncbi:MAG: replication-associated recombination protein A [Deltaproteobacteria bacterium]|nr:replication-associated recombination protein A [Deltaproteobacteria bacterium]